MLPMLSSSLGTEVSADSVNDTQSAAQQAVIQLQASIGAWTRILVQVHQDCQADQAAFLAAAAQLDAAEKQATGAEEKLETTPMDVIADLLTKRCNAAALRAAVTERLKQRDQVMREIQHINTRIDEVRTQFVTASSVAGAAPVLESVSKRARVIHGLPPPLPAPPVVANAAATPSAVTPPPSASPALPPAAAAAAARAPASNIVVYFPTDPNTRYAGLYFLTPEDFKAEPSDLGLETKYPRPGLHVRDGQECTYVAKCTKPHTNGYKRYFACHNKNEITKHMARYHADEAVAAASIPAPMDDDVATGDDDGASDTTDLEPEFTVVGVPVQFPRQKQPFAHVLYLTQAEWEHSRRILRPSLRARKVQLTAAHGAQCTDVVKCTRPGHAQESDRYFIVRRAHHVHQHNAQHHDLPIPRFDINDDTGA